LINYDQYRGLIEGFSAHAWDWYTGVIIWKTQNPWTALRGQMYDYYLDPNACLYGLREAGEMVHAAYNPVAGKVLLFNHSELGIRARVGVTTYNMSGWATDGLTRMVDLRADTVTEGPDIKGMVDSLRADKGMFLQVEILGYGRNTYWLPDSSGQYSGLRGLAETTPHVRIKRVAKGKLSVTLAGVGGAPAFFIRLSITDKGERVLPTFYSDNYITLMPGQTETVDIEWPARPRTLQMTMEGFNVPLTSLNMPPVSGK
jgi:mannosylglycoprotein endo-beta-mannosidase